MKKYRKKSIVMEAEQWDGCIDYVKVHRYFYEDQSECKYCGRLMDVHGCLKTIDNYGILCIGDWIVKGVNGEYYPVKPDIFQKTYEEIE